MAFGPSLKTPKWGISIQFPGNVTIFAESMHLCKIPKQQKNTFEEDYHLIIFHSYTGLFQAVRRFMRTRTPRLHGKTLTNTN